MNVVIYARFSSHSQTEQSIEGQLKVCYEYAKNNGYTVIGEYIDRAQSGTTDNRLEFQRMISDSDKHTFEGVLVYQLDRFARNRYDSAINKSKLKKNGVRVISAKENIADDPSGILVGAFWKVWRSIILQSFPRKFIVVWQSMQKNAFQTAAIPDLALRWIPSAVFMLTVLVNVFCNIWFEKITIYILLGVYLYKGQETPGGMPRILDDDLFYRVQALMNKNKSAPARTRGENEYLLTTKLFCGHCKEMMVGYGGTGKSGKQYHYYMCKKARKKKCDKKIISKDYIEDRVVSECLKMLTEDKIRYIAKRVAEECNKSPDNISVREIKKAIKQVDTAIENLWKGIEQGQAVEMLTERINKRKAEKAELEEQLAIEQNKKICLTEPQIHAFLDYVCDMPADDVNKRRAIINIFVHSVYLYDDRFTVIINASNHPLSIDNIPLKDIEAAFSGDTYTFDECSSMKTPAPPN